MVLKGAGGPLLLDKERNVPENWMRRWPRVGSLCAAVLCRQQHRWGKSFCFLSGSWQEVGDRMTTKRTPALFTIFNTSPTDTEWGESCTCTIAADNPISALCLPGLLLHEKQKLKVWKCWLFPKPSNFQTFKLSGPLCLATPWKGAQIDCEHSLIRNSLPLFSSQQHSQLCFTT